MMDGWGVHLLVLGWGGWVGAGRVAVRFHAAIGAAEAVDGQWVLV